MRIREEHFVYANEAPVFPKTDCFLVFLEQNVGDRKAVQAVYIPTHHGRNGRAQYLWAGRKMLRQWIADNA